MPEELYSPQRIDAITTIVSKATGVENNVLKASMKKAPKLSALYYTLSHGHIFASLDGSFLYASNSVDFATHVTKFQQGGRTPVSKDFAKFVEMTLSALNRPQSHFPTLSESDLLEDAETGENTGKSQSEGKSDGESEYRIDPRTGKRYKVLKGMDLSGMTAKDRKTALKMGMTITQLRETVDQDPEFQNMDNTSLTSLDESASIFLPHLRG